MAVIAAGAVAQVVAYLTEISMEWTTLMMAVAGLTATQSWTVYKNRRNVYLLQLSRLLYFRNIANNKGLLTLLVDRAEDELFKEMLLAYTFLLTNRPPSQRDTDINKQDHDKLGKRSRRYSITKQ